MIRQETLCSAWPVKPLGEVVEFLDHLRKPVKEKDRIPGSYPYYGANGQQGTINGYLFDEPLVLLAEDGGHFGVPDKTIAYQVIGKCWVNNHAHVLRPKKGVDIGFLCRQLEHYAVTPFITGTTRGKLTQRSASMIPVLVPPLPEQRRISAILDKADAIRRKRQEAIRLMEEFLRSAFLEMFGDPVTNPKGWAKERLGTLCTIRRGASPRPIRDYVGGTVPWIKIRDGTKGSDIYIEDTEEKIIEQGVPKSVYLEAGSLIFANCGVSLGFARILKIGGCIHDGWLSFEHISPKLDKVFLLKMLNSITYHFQRIAPEGTQPNLNTKIMKEFEVPVPSIEKQTKFTEVVLRCNGWRKQLLEANILLAEFFNSLVQRAFRGEL